MKWYMHHSGVRQESKNRLRRPFLPQPLHCRGPKALPPTVPPYPPPQSPWLRRPGPTLDEQMVARLPLSTASPPTLARLGCSRPLAKVGTNRFMERQELIAPASQGFPDPAQMLAAQAPSCRRSVPPPSQAASCLWVVLKFPFRLRS